MPDEIPVLMGSREWLSYVLSAPPVRKLKGRTKSTQYHELWSNHANRFVGAQGRNEAVALILLEYLASLGQITHFKEQPFRTSLDEFGCEIVPDYLAVGADKTIYVVEVKNSRYITAIVQANLDRNKARFAEYGIKYLCWTDRYPLSLHLRHNLIEMRRTAQCVPKEESSELKFYVATSGAKKFSSLVHAGFDLGCVYAAAWRGEAFFAPNQAFGPDSPVSPLPLIDLPAIALGSSTSGHSWWEQLSRV